METAFRWIRYCRCRWFRYSKSQRSVFHWLVVFRWSFSSICGHDQLLSKVCIGINSHAFITSREDVREIHSDLDSIDRSYPSPDAALVCCRCYSLIFTDKERDDKERSIRFDISQDCRELQQEADRSEIENDVKHSWWLSVQQGLVRSKSS